MPLIFPHYGVIKSCHLVNLYIKIYLGKTEEHITTVKLERNIPNCFWVLLKLIQVTHTMQCSVASPDFELSLQKWLGKFSTTICSGFQFYENFLFLDVHT